MGSAEMRMERLAPNPELWRLSTSPEAEGVLSHELNSKRADLPVLTTNHTHGSDACVVFKSITNGLILLVFLQRKIYPYPATCGPPGSSASWPNDFFIPFQSKSKAVVRAGGSEVGHLFNWARL